MDNIFVRVRAKYHYPNLDGQDARTYGYFFLSDQSAKDWIQSETSEMEQDYKENRQRIHLRNWKNGYPKIDTITVTREEVRDMLSSRYRTIPE